MKIAKKNSQVCQEFFNKIQEYANEMCQIQSSLLTYLDEEDEDNNNYNSLIKTIEKSKILESKIKVKSFYRMLFSIFNDHNRSNDFLSKIDKIILKYKPDLYKYYDQDKLFCLFNENKLFALTLFGEDFSSGHLDSEISKKLYLKNDDNYTQEQFETYIQNGENEEYMCELMRRDDVDNFIQYIEKVNKSKQSRVYHTQYESHMYLIKNNLSLIEYSSFFGSNEIFTYLQLNQVDLPPELWLTVIHGRNNDLIHSLEGLKVSPPNDTYQTCINEAILCHHNEYVEYIKSNLIENSNNRESLASSLKAYNFEILKNEIESDDVEIDNNVFKTLIANDHLFIVNLLIEMNLFNIDTVLEKGYITPLYLAITKGSREIVELFLQKTDVNLRTQLISFFLYISNDVSFIYFFE